MDRDAIERRDFPVGRRGYDQASVDDHLRRLADQLESLRGRTPPSSIAAEQVRVILEAAEASAADLRADAARESADHVARVERAAAAMLDRIDDVERELRTLRTSGERLNTSLARLHEEAAALGAAAEAPDEDFAAAAAPEPSPADVRTDPPPSSNGDEAGARLIALNMALSGTAREETSRYLAEHFRLPDADALLDDVYERAGR